MGPAVTDPARYRRRPAGLATALVAALGLAAFVHSARGTEPEEAAGPLLLEPAAVPAGPLLGEGLLGDEPLPPPAADDRSILAPPEVLDVSAARGMLVDDFQLDEMPLEASSGRWFWNGGWYLGAESMWMQRSRENRQKIAEDINVSGPVRLPQNYTTTGQPFDVSPGARITIGKSLGRDFVDRDRALEFVYYGGMNWYDYAGWNALPGGVIITPLNLGAAGFNYAGRYETTVRSDFNSWEWNYRLRRRLGRDQLVMGPGGDWVRHAERGFLPGLIVGTRFARMTEGFTLKSSRPDNDGILPPVPPSQFGGFYQINTQNWLLGLNLGAELVSQNEFFYWGLRGRAAPAITFANMSQAAFGVNTTTIGPTGTTSVSDAASQVGAGFLGDMTIMAGWQVTPNFSFQAGYDILWVAGVATSERQFNLDNKDLHDIDAGGQAFYQGFSIGCHGSW